MPYTRIASVGRQQPGGQQVHTLPGSYLGFTCGTRSSGSLETALNAWDAFTGGNTECTAWGLPNSMGTPGLSALAGITRFVIFSAPMIPPGGSLTRLLAGDYDSLIDATADAVVALNLGMGSTVRSGWEYNSGAGDSPTQGFGWATRHVDPYTGFVNGIALFKAAAAYTENRWRNRGYIAYFTWCGGNHDTSALPIASAIPTHGDPHTTTWDWDIYPGPPWNGTKNDIANIISHLEPIHDGYTAYCRANGIMVGHSELGMINNPASSQTPNDNDIWWPWLYQKIAKNADVIPWGCFYWQNNPYYTPGSGSTNIPLTENHQIAFSVPTSGGAPAGNPGTAAWTANYPPGTSGPNVTGSANTVANNSSRQNSSDLGTHWVWNTDPIKTKARTSWQATFGGVGEAAGLGAAGLTVAVQPAVPGQTTTAPNAVSRNHRGQLAVFA